MRLHTLGLLSDASLLRICSHLPLLEVLKLSTVCRAWASALSPNHSSFWRPLGVTHGLTTIPVGRDTHHLRSISNPKQIVFQQYRAQRRVIVEKHEQCIAEIQELLGDKPSQMCRIIQSIFNPKQGSSTSPLLSPRKTRGSSQRSTMLSPLQALMGQVRLSMKHFNVNFVSSVCEGYTLVNLCARWGKPKCLSYLASTLKADVNIPDIGGFTPLINSAFRGDLDSVRKLVCNGADVFVKGAERIHTPTHTAQEWAVIKHHMHVAQFLYTHIQTHYPTSLTECVSEQGCVCGRGLQGSMVGCDNPKCKLEWFHLSCVGLTEEPIEQVWQCPFCVRRRNLSSPQLCVCGKSEWESMVMCDCPRCPIKWFHFECVGLLQPPEGLWYCAWCINSLNIR